MSAHPPARSPIAIRVDAMFGILRAPDTAPHAALAPHADRVLNTLAPRAIVLITGPSGAGKSSLAHLIGARCRDRGIPVVDPGDDRGHPSGPHAPSSSPVDLLSGPLTCRLRLLAGVGLADARLFGRPVAALSVGERARLRIALALDAARRLRAGAPPPVILLDEFGSSLDRPAAIRLARLLRRRAGDAPPARLICLTAHDDLADALEPDLHLALHPGPQGPVVERLGPGGRTPRPTGAETDVRVEPGAYGDYAALAHHHYRGGRPAVLAGPGAIRRAVDPHTGRVVGVLVLAMPTLNASWRDVAWPGRYRTGNKRADAARLRDELRTIARVIVAPEHRGRGIGVALVRHYLAHPATPATEAVAAMGLACPFFERAGMTPYRLPPTPRDARLLDCLAHLGLSPSALLDPHGPGAEGGALLARELDRWAGRSRSTRHLEGDRRAVGTLAASALLARPVAFAHVRPDTPLEDHRDAQTPTLASPGHRRAA